jgi:hypothetical protein
MIPGEDRVFYKATMMVETRDPIRRPMDAALEVLPLISTFG